MLAEGGGLKRTGVQASSRARHPRNTLTDCVRGGHGQLEVGCKQDPQRRPAAGGPGTTDRQCLCLVRMSMRMRMCVWQAAGGTGHHRAVQARARRPHAPRLGGQHAKHEELWKRRKRARLGDATRHGLVLVRGGGGGGGVERVLARMGIACRVVARVCTRVRHAGTQQHSSDTPWSRSRPAGWRRRTQTRPRCRPPTTATASWSLYVVCVCVRAAGPRVSNATHTRRSNLWQPHASATRTLAHARHAAQRRAHSPTELPKQLATSLAPMP
jgi:hypothetical protein